METNINSLSLVVDAIRELLQKAKLDGKPFVLGLLTEDADGKLNRLLNDNRSTFNSLGATKIEWRDDALRSSIIVLGEQLHISVHRA